MKHPLGVNGWRQSGGRFALNLRHEGRNGSFHHIFAQSVHESQTQKARLGAVTRVHLNNEVDLVAKLGDIKYVYTRTWGDHARVFKIVSFYLFSHRAGTLGTIAPEMQHEVAAAKWIPLADAPKLLAYKGEKQMARSAQQYVAEHPELAAKQAQHRDNETQRKTS